MAKKPSVSLTSAAVQKQATLLKQPWLERVSPKIKAWLQRTRHFYFIGTGSSYHVAQWGAWWFDSAQAFTSWDLLYRIETKAFCPPRDSLFVVCSHRGAQGITREVLNKLRDYPTVLLCAEKSPTGGVPTVFTSPAETSLAHTMSVSAAMAVIFGFSEIKNGSKRLLLLPALEYLQAFSSAKIPKFSQERPVTIVGAGELHAVAQEIALKIREICYLPATAIAVEELLHGPYIAVEKGDLALHLCPDQGARGQASAKLLKNLGASLILPDRSILKLPRIPRSFATLFWGQKYCLDLAVKLGTNPDGNRTEQRLYANAKRLAEFHTISFKKW